MQMDVVGGLEDEFEVLEAQKNHCHSMSSLVPPVVVAAAGT
jgi:hypothetical protein